MKLYFAYGANLNIESMRVRCPDAVAIQPFYLEDYRLAFSSVATILPAEGLRVPGALWAISEQDEQALDRFEGWPYMYQKETVQQDGLEFMVYVMNDTQPWEPSASYLATIAEGYEDFGLALEDLEQAVVRNQLEIDDYDMQRSTLSGVGLDTYVEEPVRSQFGHDLRWLCDEWMADDFAKTIQ